MLLRATNVIILTFFRSSIVETVNATPNLLVTSQRLVYDADTACIELCGELHDEDVGNVAHSCIYQAVPEREDRSRAFTPGTYTIRPLGTTIEYELA